MKILFQLQVDDKEATPIKVADALISCDMFKRRDLQEIAAHLDVYCNKQMGEEINKAYQVSEAMLKGTEE